MGFLEIDRKSISLLVAGRVQEYGFLPGVGALPCFEYALTKAGGGLRHADENHWLRQFWNVAGKALMYVFHRLRCHWKVFAEDVG